MRFCVNAKDLDQTWHLPHYIPLKDFGLSYPKLDASLVAKIEGTIISQLLTSFSERSPQKILPAPTQFWKMSAHIEEVNGRRQSRNSDA